MALLRRIKLLAGCATLPCLPQSLLQLPAQNLKPHRRRVDCQRREEPGGRRLTRIVGMEDTGKTAQLFGNALQRRGQAAPPD